MQVDKYSRKKQSDISVTKIFQMDWEQKANKSNTTIIYLSIYLSIYIYICENWIESYRIDSKHNTQVLSEKSYTNKFVSSVTF